MHIIACIEDAVVIEKVLTHLNEKALPIAAPLLPERWAPRAKRAGSTERFETTYSAQVSAPRTRTPRTRAARHRLAGKGSKAGERLSEGGGTKQDFVAIRRKALETARE